VSRLAVDLVEGGPWLGPALRSGRIPHTNGPAGRGWSALAVGCITVAGHAMARNVGYVSLTPLSGAQQGRGVEQRRTVFVIFDGFQPLDMVGPHEVFSHAAGLGGGYVCEVVAAQAGLVRSASGLPVHAAGVQDSGPDGVDTLVIAGGTGVDQGVSAGIDMALWLVGALHGRDHARQVRRYIQYDPAPPYLADEPVSDAVVAASAG
jgi:hypothetical protein